MILYIQFVYYKSRWENKFVPELIYIKFSKLVINKCGKTVSKFRVQIISRNFDTDSLRHSEALIFLI